MPGAGRYLKRNPPLRRCQRILNRHEPRVAEHIHILTSTGGVVCSPGNRFHYRLTVDHDDISTAPFCFARKPRDQRWRNVGEFHSNDQVHAEMLRRIPDSARRLHQVGEVRGVCVVGDGDGAVTEDGRPANQFRREQLTVREKGVGVQVVHRRHFRLPRRFATRRIRSSLLPSHSTTTRPSRSAHRAGW